MIRRRIRAMLPSVTLWMSNNMALLKECAVSSSPGYKHGTPTGVPRCCRGVAINMALLPECLVLLVRGYKHRTPTGVIKRWKR
jgi:hypothetical protein